MFEDKHNMEFEDLMKNILGDAQEEVPAHIWASVSDRLDKIEAAKVRKPVIIMFRRIAVATAAAAAVIMGLFLGLDRNEDIVRDSFDSDLIAVIRNDNAAENSVFLAEASLPRPESIDISRLAATHSEPETTGNGPAVAAPAGSVSEEKTEPSATVHKEQPVYDTIMPDNHYFTDIWQDEEPYSTKRSKTGTSFTFSGNVGTNNPQNTSSGGPMKRPSISTLRPETGVRQTSTESIYGLPVSFGAGVRIGIIPRLSIGTGVNYTLLTRKFYGTYTHVNEDGVVDKTVSSDIRNTQHYIGIPVNLFYTIVDNRGLNFYAYAGGAMEKCIADKYSLLDTSITHQESVNGFQFSVNAGVGVEFMVGEHIGLYVDPRIRYYFNNGQPKSIRTAQPLMMEFEMGLRFNL